MDKFFMVYVEGTQSTKMQHATEGEASIEAERLALNNIGKRVFLLDSTVYCIAEKPVIKWEHKSKYNDGWR